MSLILPNKKLLKTTSDVDYYLWNYQFPIKYIQRFRFKAILKLMGHDYYDKILEVGTGSGIFLSELSRHCHELHACDVHDKLDAVARLCELTATKANLKQCPINQTDFPDDFFDVIIAISVLEFLDDLETSFGEIKRILKTDGTFLTIFPQHNILFDFVIRLFNGKNGDKVYRQSPSKIFFMLEKHFAIRKRYIFPAIIGRVFPVYYYYKVGLKGLTCSKML